MKRVLLTTLILTFALSSLVALANDKKPPTPEEMAKMMELWQKAATPGSQHAVLAQMMGNWDFTMKMYGMGDEPMESKGTATYEMLFDGRFLRLAVNGSMMNMPFLGQGTMGYDNFGERYQLTWCDNMGTIQVYAEGKEGKDPNVITVTGKMDEPTTGERNKTVKYVYRVTDKDHHTFEAYDLVGTPKEFKVFDITYTRTK